jgi:hypothetical protein
LRWHRLVDAGRLLILKGGAVAVVKEGVEIARVTGPGVCRSRPLPSMRRSGGRSIQFSPWPKRRT